MPRPLGSKNKISKSLKEAILRAFERAGGVAYLERVAADDPRTFCALIGKVLPLQITGDATNPVTITVVTSVPRAGDN